MINITQQIAQLRREYISRPLTKETSPDHPIDQFKSWFEEAVRAEQPDPEAMTLSTATNDGHVSARIVLLKIVDERGFAFFTNYESRKSREMIANPRAALTLYWSSLNRQIRIEGLVEKVSSEESEQYFQTRPRGSQLGAWASPQSDEIAHRLVLDQRLAEAEERFADQPIPCPPFWGGFRVRPECIEFWQGREDRLHDRILYSRTEEGWKMARLAP